jgi:hypothetical protein
MIIGLGMKCRGIVGLRRFRGWAKFSFSNCQNFPVHFQKKKNQNPSIINKRKIPNPQIQKAIKKIK